MGSEDKTHLGMQVAAGAAEEPEFSNIKKRHTEQLKRYTEPEKQVHNNSYRLKTPSVCECASVLTQCVNVVVIQPSQRKLSLILLPLSLTLSHTVS